MIIGYFGNLSGGKTISMIRTAILEQQRTKRRIITNMRLSNCDNVRLSDDEFIMFLKKNYQNQDALKKMFSNSILVFDEMTGIIDGRRTSSNVNLLACQFLMMCHKINANPCLFSSQIPSSQIDLRLREITNAWAKCMRLTKEGIPIFSTERKLKDENGKDIPILIQIAWEIDLETFGIKTPIEVFDPSEYYKYYDTEEIILLDRDKYLTRR